MELQLLMELSGRRSWYNFREPGTEIYEGMIVGEHTRENDLTINITKAKQATNIRSANKDQTNTTKKPRIMTLEESLNT